LGKCEPREALAGNIQVIFSNEALSAERESVCDFPLLLNCNKRKNPIFFPRLF
jgi:hypothetical protein